MKIENELIRLIKLSEEAEEPIDAASWGHEQGVLLSRAEALEMVRVIGQLKSLEAAAYGMTLHSLFLLMLKGCTIKFISLDGIIQVTVRTKDGKFNIGSIAKDLIYDGKVVDKFFNDLIQAL